MLGVLSLALAAGAASGLARVTVRTVTFILVVVSLIAAALGFRLGLPPGRVVLILFSVCMLVQAAYLVGAALSEPPNAYPVSDHIPPEPELLRTVRTAIGRELREYFSASLEDVSPQLRNKLALLEKR
jgi:hypothetical protein